jgi:hypothetical protein
MSLSANHRSEGLPNSRLPNTRPPNVRSPNVRSAKSRLPKSFPVGATYVVEGQGGDDGVFRVSSRYLVLPRGKRIDLPANLDRPQAGRAVASRRTSQQGQVKSRPARKKFAAGRGTARRNRR